MRQVPTEAEAEAMSRRILVAVVTDATGAELLHRHARYQVVFAAPSGTTHSTAATVQPEDDTGKVSPEPLLLDYLGAAHRLALSERKVRQLVADGQLGAVSVGRSRRIPAAELERFVERLGADSAA
ncbi:MAG TPA: helix-turn-helix domain-containing protein [Acidimicrobiales bacterium]|nr:helix-turn-helix domain-containing protein [Acidimicrobiales bacterium]